MEILFIFEISDTAAVLVIIFIIFLLVYQLKDRFPLGCTVIAAVFLFLFVKTCRELDEEEEQERLRSEEIDRRLEEQKKILEMKKQMRLSGHSSQDGEQPKTH